MKHYQVVNLVSTLPCAVVAIIFMLMHTRTEACLFSIMATIFASLAFITAWNPLKHPLPPVPPKPAKE